MSEAWAATKKNAVARATDIMQKHLLPIALSMYVTTAYHTCLFLWARNVEDAGMGAPGTVKPPVPISNALGV
jgi:hypothetical protein